MKKSILCALLGCVMLAGGGFDACGAVAFGPGKVSKFTVSGVGSGVLVGASGVTWANFSSTDYYGTKVFVNQGIVDAEKTAANDPDDLWCYHISDMDALFLTGWSKKTSFSNVDAMKNHFNGDSIRKMSGGDFVEGTYGFVRNGTWGDLFYWYKNASGIDLAAHGALTEGTIGSSFASTLKSLMDDGGHVVRVNVFFSEILRNKRWNTTGWSMTHGVLCVGYVANGNSLKALFLVDADNDQFTGSGGTSAPNSVMYCPVSWNSSANQYTISGVWGQNGVLNPEYRALAVLKESTPTPTPTPTPAGTYTVRFSDCGGKGTMAAQTLAVGSSATLRKNAFKRSGHVFLGWAKSKSGKVAYKNAATVKNLAAKGKTVTLYAKWAKKNYKVKFYANGGKGKMAVQKFTYGKAKKLSKNKFTRKGYVFKGWATSKANAKKGKVKYKNGKAVKNLVANGKTVKLFAVWAAKSKEGLCIDGLSFTTGGAAKWKTSGKNAFRSGAISHGQNSWLKVVFPHDGTFTYTVRISSEPKHDKLQVFLDGHYSESISGENSYLVEWTLTKGTTLMWKYTKNSSLSEGHDCAWISDIKWTPN